MMTPRQYEFFYHLNQFFDGALAQTGGPIEDEFPDDPSDYPEHIPEIVYQNEAKYNEEYAKNLPIFCGNKAAASYWAERKCQSY